MKISLDDVKRISRLAHLQFSDPIENLSVSPQCGFASHQQGTALTFAEQEAKLKLVVDIASETWGES